MKAIQRPDYSTITEHPGLPAPRIQRAMLEARYAWALSRSVNKDVLEVACGAGLGLEILARQARTVAAGDLDHTNVRLAREASADLANVRVEPLDASDLPFEARSFDVVLLFEAIYYLPDVERFLCEARRVLRPGGRLLITTVNCAWPGFHPSPFSTRYLNAAELEQALDQAGFEVRASAGFPQGSALVNAVRRLAVKAGLVPQTLRGRAILKRFVYGRMNPLPVRLTSARPAARTAVKEVSALERYRVLYVEGTKI